MNENCPVCQGGHAPYGLGVERCTQCGHGWYAGGPLQVPPQDLYTERYFHGVDYSDYRGDEGALKQNFRGYCRRMQEVLPQQASILEIGCAYGFFLEVAGEWFKARGVDISGDAVRAALKRGVTVECADYLKLPSPQAPYDAVCFWDCIEHLADPGAFVHKAARELSPGGWIFLTTGDFSSANARRRGTAWRMLHPPTHLHYFTRESMRRLMASAGCELRQSATIAQWHSLRGAVGGLALHAKQKAVAETARLIYTFLPKATARLMFPLPTGDIMWIAAQKSHADI